MPNTPNAAALKLFGNIPIDHYSGSANVSIPIYEIELAGKKIPIVLSYNTSGIKVAQEASWVGLGWALNAGGFITRDNMDKSDFGTSDYLGYYINPDNLVDRYNGIIGSVENEGSTCLSFWGSTAGRILDISMQNDGAADLFHYNFAGHSGTMFIDKNNDVVQIANRKEYIQAKYVQTTNSWIIMRIRG
jgi:hypothetical protein